ncbi:MAG: hypothetical protein KA310_03345 [Pseudomonadales bacterium]|nr:hypothetical protein [Pseudomonadales bacterium]
MTDPNDLFPEVAKDPEIAARQRAFSRHQHSMVGVGDANNERYTLAPTLEQCMRFAWVDRIDIDVAACPEAHCADEWLGRQADGSFRDALTCSWTPRAFPMHPALRPRPLIGWCNMPYTLLLEFMERAMLAMVDRELDILMMLPPGDRCEQPWWQTWVEPYRDGRGHYKGVVVETKCLPGRQKFGSPGDPKGLLASSAPFPSVCVVLRGPGSRTLR